MPYIYPPYIEPYSWNMNAIKRMQDVWESGKNTEWCESLSLIARREERTEGGRKGVGSESLCLPSAFFPPPVRARSALAAFLSCVFCPRRQSSPVLLRLLNRWPVGSLTLINLTSIRPEVIGMPRRWLQGSGAAYESPRPLMNGSPHAWNMCVWAPERWL